MTDIQNVYFESSILTASPVELVRLLLRRAVADVQHARERLREGDIAARAEAISHAAEVLTELICALDEQSAPVYAANAKRLYAYILERLLEGNCRQEDQPFAEAEGLLADLASAWESMEEDQPAQAAQGAPYLVEPEFTFEACVA